MLRRPRLDVMQPCRPGRRSWVPVLETGRPLAPA